VDVLVITAMKEEYDAVRALAGLTDWQQHDAGGSAPYATTVYAAESGRTMSVALARPTHMGGRSTSPIAADGVADAGACPISGCRCQGGRQRRGDESGVVIRLTSNALVITLTV
jgi:hypothetical protein